MKRRESPDLADAPLTPLRQGGNKPLEEEESEFFDILREAERERQRTKQASDERELQSFHVRSLGWSGCLSNLTKLLQLLREQALLKKAVEPSLAAPRPMPPPRPASSRPRPLSARVCLSLLFLAVFGSPLLGLQPRDEAVLVASKRPREEEPKNESSVLAGLAAYGSDSE